MSGLLLAGLALSIGGGTDAGHRDASIEVDGLLLGARFVDVDEDGKRELVLAVRVAGSDRRELRIHPLGRDGAPAPRPTSVVPVLSDVIAFGLADVRDEPGKEVLLFARKGVWSVSPTKEGLRGNLRPLLEANLVYDVADPEALPFWEHVLDGDRDFVVVPGESTFSVWGPGSEDDAGPGYVKLVDFSAAVSAGSRDNHGAVKVERKASFSVGASDVDMEYDDADPRRVLLDRDLVSRFRLLSFGRSYVAPGIGDADGDGRDDLMVIAKDGMWVHLAGSNGIDARPTRIEPNPKYLSEADRIDLVDVDGDGDDDLFYMVVDDEDAEGFASEEFTLGVLVNDGRKMLPGEPSQLLRFEAMELRYSVADVTGDGVPDLVVRKFEMPSMLEVVTSLDFRYSTLIYPGTGKRGRVFERKPILKDERVFDEDSLQDVIAARELTHDLSGDGIADLVEVDANGRVSFRRLKLEKGFFRGESWSLERSPWKRFDSRGSISSLSVDDFNGDGVGDVASVRSDGLLLLLSTGGGR